MLSVQLARVLYWAGLLLTYRYLPWRATRRSLVCCDRSSGRLDSHDHEGDEILPADSPGPIPSPAPPNERPRRRALLCCRLIRAMQRVGVLPKLLVWGIKRRRCAAPGPAPAPGLWPWRPRPGARRATPREPQISTAHSSRTLVNGPYLLRRSAARLVSSGLAWRGRRRAWLHAHLCVAIMTILRHLAPVSPAGRPLLEVDDPIAIVGTPTHPLLVDAGCEPYRRDQPQGKHADHKDRKCNRAADEQSDHRGEQRGAADNVCDPGNSCGSRDRTPQARAVAAPMLKASTTAVAPRPLEISHRLVPLRNAA